MEQKVINNKYEILDTLHSDGSQSIYICREASGRSEERFILNEFVDKEIIDAVKDSFSYSHDLISKSMLDSFQLDDKYYALFPMASGTPLEEHLSRHNITLADKMLLTEELLKKFMEIERSAPLIQYTLCDLNNLSVTGRRYLSFSNLFCFDKDNLNVGMSSVITRLGQIICCIFANTPEGDINKDKDSMPPAMLPIISKAIAGSYGSAAKIYEDFKKTLLYTTFIGTDSLDDQIRTNIKRAQKKRVIYWPRFIASIIILAALFGGGFWLFKKVLPVFSPGSKDPAVAATKNEAPVAEFSISINKVYSGDDVTFIDKSTDSDPGDTIKSRLWTVERNGTTVLNSDKEVLNYVFDKPGDYEVSLVVQDSKGKKSQPFTHKLKVLEKPEIPDDEPKHSNDDKDNLK